MTKIRINVCYEPNVNGGLRKVATISDWDAYLDRLDEKGVERPLLKSNGTCRIEVGKQMPTHFEDEIPAIFHLDPEEVEIVIEANFQLKVTDEWVDVPTVEIEYTRKGSYRVQLSQDELDTLEINPKAGAPCRIDGYARKISVRAPTNLGRIDLVCT